MAPELQQLRPPRRPWRGRQWLKEDGLRVTLWTECLAGHPSGHNGAEISRRSGCTAIPRPGGSKPAKLETAPWCACAVHQRRRDFAHRYPKGSTSRAVRTSHHQALSMVNSMGICEARRSHATATSRSNPRATPAQSGIPAPWPRAVFIERGPPLRRACATKIPVKRPAVRRRRPFMEAVRQLDAVEV